MDFPLVPNFARRERRHELRLLYASSYSLHLILLLMRLFQTSVAQSLVLRSFQSFLLSPGGRSTRLEFSSVPWEGPFLPSSLGLLLAASITVL